MLNILNQVLPRAWQGWPAPQTLPQTLPDEILLQFARTPGLLAVFRRTCRQFRHATGTWDLTITGDTILVNGQVVYDDALYFGQSRMFGKRAADHCMLVGHGDTLVYGGMIMYATLNSNVLKQAAAMFPGATLDNNYGAWMLSLVLSGTAEYVNAEIARLRAIAPNCGRGDILAHMYVYVTKYIPAKDAALLYSAV